MATTPPIAAGASCVAMAFQNPPDEADGTGGTAAGTAAENIDHSVDAVDGGGSMAANNAGVAALSTPEAESGARRRGGSQPWPSREQGTACARPQDTFVTSATEELRENQAVHWLFQMLLEPCDPREATIPCASVAVRAAHCASLAASGFGTAGGLTKENVINAIKRVMSSQQTTLKAVAKVFPSVAKVTFKRPDQVCVSSSRSRVCCGRRIFLLFVVAC